MTNKWHPISQTLRENNNSHSVQQMGGKEQTSDLIILPMGISQVSLSGPPGKFDACIMPPSESTFLTWLLRYNTLLLLSCYSFSVVLVGSSSSLGLLVPGRDSGIFQAPFLVSLQCSLPVAQYTKMMKGKTTTKHTLPRKAPIQIWWRDQKFYRQAEGKSSAPNQLYKKSQMGFSKQ